MSLLLDRIRKDALSARKARDPKAGVLVTLIGEADNKAKVDKEPKPFTDAQTVALVRKFLKGIEETLAAVGVNEKAMIEKAALEVYLPKQMDETELEAFARAAIAAGANLGGVMAQLKSQRAGQYDGKLASEIVRQIVAENA